MTNRNGQWPRYNKPMREQPENDNNISDFFLNVFTLSFLTVQLPVECQKAESMKIALKRYTWMAVALFKWIHCDARGLQRVK